MIDVPRGIRNNNPGNIEANPHVIWRGERKPPDGPYCRFDTPADGLRCLAKVLFAYRADHCITLAQMIERFSPDPETKAYIADVSQRTGIKPDDPFSYDNGDALALMQAIVEHENANHNPYTVKQYSDAIVAALSS